KALAHVVGNPLQLKAEECDSSSSEVHDFDFQQADRSEEMGLVLIQYGREQMQLRTMSLARGDEGPHVLRKAGAAEANAGHHEPGVYPRVQAQAAVNLVIRNAERLAHIREFVREGDLGRAERVRRIL